MLKYVLLFVFSISTYSISYAQWMSIKKLSPYVHENASKSVELFFGTDWMVEVIHKDKFMYSTNSDNSDACYYAIFISEEKEYWDELSKKKIYESSIQIDPNCNFNYYKYLNEIKTSEFILVDEKTIKSNDPDTKEEISKYALFKKGSIGVITIQSNGLNGKYIYSIVEIFNIENQDIIDVMFNHTKVYIGQSKVVRELKE